MARATGLHPQMRPGDVLVGDRAFDSFTHLALLVRRGLRGPVSCERAPRSRLHTNRVTPGRWTGRGFGASAVSVDPGAGERPTGSWTGTNPPCGPSGSPGRLRVVAQVAPGFARPDTTVTRPGFRVRSVTLVTTLLDAEVYPLEALADLYRQRWQVETDLRHLKTTLGMDVVRCRTEAGVLKEVTMFALVYNLVRVAMTEAGRRQVYRSSGSASRGTLRWLASPLSALSLPRLVVNPDRPDHVEPRACRSGAGKNYPYMIQPRTALRQRRAAQALPP